MKKTIKKIDNKLISALTIVCEQAKVTVVGFEWLTHTADYANFPSSLHVRCIFDTDSSLTLAKSSGSDTKMIKLIHCALLKAGILLKDPKRHITFDSEQACEREHQGNWPIRIRTIH